MHLQHNRTIDQFPFAYGGRLTVKVQLQQYANDGIRLNLLYFDHEMGGWFPQATCSSWIPGLEPDELAIKDYSENEGMLKALVEAEVVLHPHRLLNGFPVVKLDNWEAKRDAMMSQWNVG